MKLIKFLAALPILLLALVGLALLVVALGALAAGLVAGLTVACVGGVLVLPLFLFAAIDQNDSTPRREDAKAQPEGGK